MNIDRNEKLLSAWLKLTASLWNERMVMTMSFNEAFVLSLLSSNSKENPRCPMLTATALCEGTGLLKSQMNRTLNILEDKGYITRHKSSNDKRVVFVTLTPTGRAAYLKEHEHILDVVDNIATHIGSERTEEVSRALEDLAEATKHIERW